MTDELRITTLAVDHGDAILLQWANNDDRWTCLVDGGSSPQRLNAHLDEIGVGELDLLVLSHLDSDHIGGLAGLERRMNIGAFWGPALPAFERHLWLFGQRGVEAIERGRRLEDSLLRAGVDICYPLEGYASAPFISVGGISVMSPASRLIRRLLTEDDVSELLTQQPMPMGWLAQAMPEHSQDEAGHVVALDAALSRGFLVPGDLTDIPPLRRQPDGDWSATAQRWATETGSEPEFFGDSLLNNTSLVLYFEVRVSGRLYRVLLPGDQENWTYLFSRNPRGLHADILKASHHGGRVYVESDPAHEELLSSVQPQVLLMSANGRYQLPRKTIRDAATRWGATVMCTCRRRLELIDDDGHQDECCHAAHKCMQADNVALVMNSSGIRGETPACNSGYGRRIGPIISVRQHILDPSPVTGHLFEHELRKHISWVRTRLEGIHADRRLAAAELCEGSAPVSVEDLRTLARQERRTSLVPHLTDVLSKGMERGEFWASRTNGYYGRDWHAYVLPTPNEVSCVQQLLRLKAMVLFPKSPGPVIRDKDSLVNGLELEEMAAYADVVLHLPAEAFRDALWPSIAGMFKSRDWHCYLHRSGMLGFSTASDTLGLLTTLIRPCIQEDCIGTLQIEVDSKQLPFAGSVLVSGRDKKGERLSPQEQSSFIRAWMRVKQTDCSPEEWAHLRSLGMVELERSWGSRSGSEEVFRHLAEKTEGDAERAASVLEFAVEKLW